MAKQFEVIEEEDKSLLEVQRRRDRKTIRKALGKSAVSSLRAKETLKNINKKGPKVELESNQFEPIIKSLGELASEKGFSKIIQRYKSRKLSKRLKQAEKELG